jgi:hypothetical protein
MKRNIEVEIKVDGEVTERCWWKKMTKREYDKFVDALWDLINLHFPDKEEENEKSRKQ